MTSLDQAMKDADYTNALERYERLDDQALLDAERRFREIDGDQVARGFRGLIDDQQWMALRAVMLRRNLHV